MTARSKTSFLALAVISALNIGRYAAALDGAGLSTLGWTALVLSLAVMIVSVTLLVRDFRSA
jgi:hypothetical protein